MNTEKLDKFVPVTLMSISLIQIGCALRRVIVFTHYQRNQVVVAQTAQRLHKNVLIVNSILKLILFGFI